MSVIIKSKSRKEPTFRQLFNYIMRDKDASQTLLVHNVFGATHSQIIEKFEKNAQLLAAHNGGNFLYHEMISLPELKDVPFEQQEIALLDIARKYLNQRAENQLAIGAVHFDKAHVHLHLMISANNFREKKRVRLERKTFSKIQRSIENYQISKYPSLGKNILYNQSEKVLEKAVKVKDNEFQFNKRTGHRTEKEQVRLMAENALLEGGTQAHFLSLLAEHNLELYQSRGAYGVINHDTGRKHRFKTLGLKELFESKVKGFVQIERNKKEIEQIRKLQREKRQRDMNKGREDEDFDR